MPAAAQLPEQPAAELAARAACAREAAAVLDEVAVLETLVRGDCVPGLAATSRLPLAAAPAIAQPVNFDSALQSYGFQLRSWVEMHVDARVSSLLQGSLGLADTTASDVRRDVAEALAIGAKLEKEVARASETQGQLLAFVDGLSDETMRIKATVLESRYAGALDAARSDAVAEAASNEEFRRLAAQSEELRRGLSELQGRSALIDDDATVPKAWLASLAEERERTERQLARLREELREEVAASMGRVSESLVELRAEAAASLRKEASLRAALDEQLWLTDQRLGQRIDDLAHLHLRERAVMPLPLVAGAPTSSRGRLPGDGCSAASDGCLATRASPELQGMAPRKGVVVETSAREPRAY